MLIFPDHHEFDSKDIIKIQQTFDNIANPSKIIVTTEKDAMRLTKFQQALSEYPLYVIPIEMRFLFGGEKAFTELIANFISTFKLKNKESDARQEII